MGGGGGGKKGGAPSPPPPPPPPPQPRDPGAQAAAARILRKEIAAYKAKFGELQKAAGVTRQSAGGQPIIQGKPKTPREAILRAAAKLRAQGQAVPAEWETGALGAVGN
mgnify:CR=1 FL=1